MQLVSREDLKTDASPNVAPYGRQPRSRGTTSATSDLPPVWRDARAGSQPARFVAGSTFFHYDAYGSLRPEHEPIYLFSRHHIGLAIHAMACGFASYFFTYGFGRLLAEYLRADSKQQVDAANYTLVWPSALSIFIGLFSDSFSVFRYRRKAFMMLGWIINLGMFVVIIIIDTFSKSGELVKRPLSFYDGAGSDEHDDSNPYAIPYMIISLLTSLGIQISWVSSLAASVEYAQREHIHTRGRLQACIMAVYYVGGVAGQALTAYLITEHDSNDHIESKISMSEAAIILAAVSLVILPILFLFFDEEPSPCNSMTLRDRLKTFWKFCHHNVVYRTLFFIMLHLLFIGQYNQNVRDTVETWSGVTRNKALIVDACRLATNMLSVLAWRSYFRNTGWRNLVLVGSILYISAYIVVTVFTTFNVIRNQWFYGFLIMVTEIPRAWLLLFTLLLAAEIADVGHEGVTVGLAISYQYLVGLVDFTLAAKFPGLMGFKASDEEVKEDTQETRIKVIKAFAIITTVNFFCLLAIKLLPQQKLDAQQLRAFGGYNKYASTGLAVAFGVMLFFNLAANLMVIM